MSALLCVIHMCVTCFQPGADSGCTAVVAVLRDRELHVANAGDSRCVVCRAGKAIDMSIGTSAMKYMYANLSPHRYPQPTVL